MPQRKGQSPKAEETASSLPAEGEALFVSHRLVNAIG